MKIIVLGAALCFALGVVCAFFSAFRPMTGFWALGVVFALAANH